MDRQLFPSFFLGGFECSTHRLRNGRRLDLIASTAHDRFVEEDYLRMQAVGIKTCRDGFRWHLVEQRPYEYDFSSALPMVRAAQRTGMTVVWDLFHYGWPDDLDILSPAFVDRFASFSHAMARLLREESDQPVMVSPVNEISFVSWGGGDVEYLNPFLRGRGHELKHQLIRASVAAIEAVWEVLPSARICSIDPIIHIVPNPRRTHETEAQEAEAYRLGMFEAWDMLSGRQCPELGGRPEYLDIIGVNYYWNNQWENFGGTLSPWDDRYRPVWQILREVHERYQRPIFIAETGIENDKRAAWLAYMGGEARRALQEGVPLAGLCLYPILNHPGWDNDRHCCNGLWDYFDEQGHREIHQPLADELARQQQELARWQGVSSRRKRPVHLDTVRIHD